MPSSKQLLGEILGSALYGSKRASVADKLHAAAGEEGIVADKKSIGSLAHKTCERRMDLAAL